MPREPAEIAIPDPDGLLVFTADAGSVPQGFLIHDDRPGSREKEKSRVAILKAPTYFITRDREHTARESGCLNREHVRPGGH